MALPSLQLYQNTSIVTVAWETSADMRYYRLLVSRTGVPGSYSVTKERIPNIATMGKRKVHVDLLRSDVGAREGDSFYIWLQGTDNLGKEWVDSPPRMIGAVSRQMVDAGANNSPLTVSENLSMTVGDTPVRVSLAHDVKFLEVYNNSEEAVLYVDVTGVDSSVERSMPVRPFTYYTVFRNISKDTGVSLVASDGEVDARVVAHY